MIDANGWHLRARHRHSPNADARPGEPGGNAIALIVIHNISLPPGQFGGAAVEQLFTNRLKPEEHPSFAAIAQMRVSAHFFMARNGKLVQFVSVNRRAWHAGVSIWRGRERCNDFSVGIELEGTDEKPYTVKQYARLARLMRELAQRYPSIQGVAGHADIAPGRKTDPGRSFDWERLMADSGLPQRFRNLA